MGCPNMQSVSSWPIHNNRVNVTAFKARFAVSGQRVAAQLNRIDMKRFAFEKSSNDSH